MTIKFFVKFLKVSEECHGRDEMPGQNCHEHFTSICQSLSLRFPKNNNKKCLWGHGMFMFHL